MYKVFFDDRVVFFVENLCDNLKKNFGLFYRYFDSNELSLILSIFDKVNEIPYLFLCSDDTNQLKKKFTANFTFIEAAGGLVKNKNNEYLFIHRLGKWDLPKGKAEKNESIEQTAIRETEEECGIHGMTILDELPSTYHTYHNEGSWILKRTYWYSMSYEGNEELIPQTKENIEQARWFTLQDVPEVIINTYPSILDVMKSVGIV